MARSGRELDGVIVSTVISRCSTSPGRVALGHVSEMSAPITPLASAAGGQPVEERAASLFVVKMEELRVISRSEPRHFGLGDLIGGAVERHSFGEIVKPQPAWLDRLGRRTLSRH